MKVNKKEIKGIAVAYDSCHKLYVCEDEKDIEDAKKIGYEIYNLEEIQELYNKSCDLRFISNWKLDTYYVKQFEKAFFRK